MLLGQVIAGVGLVFVLFYVVVRLLWGSYLGADPSLGLSISLFVLLVGVIVAALLWIGREIFAIAGPAAHRIRDRS